MNFDVDTGQTKTTKTMRTKTEIADIIRESNKNAECPECIFTVKHNKRVRLQKELNECMDQTTFATGFCDNGLAGLVMFQSEKLKYRIELLREELNKIKVHPNDCAIDWLICEAGLSIEEVEYFCEI